jgi:hypothetical protein
MNRNKTIDLKKYGMLEDIKEAKGDKLFTKILASRISKIKEEGKAREEKYIKQSQAKIKNRADVYSQAENKNITTPKEYKAYKQRLQEVKNISATKERIKKGIYKAGSRIETGVHAALESATSRLGQQLKQRVIARKILKPNKMEVHIKERTPAPYVPIFWKDTFNKEKRSMFFE